MLHDEARTLASKLRLNETGCGSTDGPIKGRHTGSLSIYNPRNLPRDRANPPRTVSGRLESNCSLHEAVYGAGSHCTQPTDASVNALAKHCPQLDSPFQWLPDAALAKRCLLLTSVSSRVVYSHVPYEGVIGGRSHHRCVWQCRVSSVAGIGAHRTSEEFLLATARHGIFLYFL